jgi:hypothetical protein
MEQREHVSSVFSPVAETRHSSNPLRSSRQSCRAGVRAQNKRGGRVKLHALVQTQSEFDHADKGDALYAFELALCALRSGGVA